MSAKNSMQTRHQIHESDFVCFCGGNIVRRAVKEVLAEDVSKELECVFILDLSLLNFVCHILLCLAERRCIKCLNIT